MTHMHVAANDHRFDVLRAMRSFAATCFGLGEVLYGPFFDLAPRKAPWPAGIMSEYGKLATAAARAGWHVHQHVINNNAVTDLLDTLEQVNRTQPLNGLRWTLGHIYDISPANIARANALGITLGVHGAAMQAGARVRARPQTGSIRQS